MRRRTIFGIIFVVAGVLKLADLWGIVYLVTGEGERLRVLASLQ